MNLTDLHDELQTRAHEFDHDFTTAASAMARGVERKVAATKRRRAGAIAGAAAVALVVGVFVGNSLGTPKAALVPAGSHSASASSLKTGTDGMPTRTIPDAAGDIVKDGLRFRAAIAGERLAGGRIGGLGDSAITFTWTPTTSHVQFTAECWLPGSREEVVKEGVLAQVTVGGQQVLESPCQPGTPPAGDLNVGGWIPGERGQGMTQLSVGAPTTVTMGLVDKRTHEPVTIADGRLAAAVYALGPQRPITDSSGATVGVLPESIDLHGVDYRLDTLATSPAAKGALAGVATPVGTPFVVTWGSAGTESPAPGSGTHSDSTTGTTYLTGLSEETARLGYGGWSDQTQPARAAGMVALRHEGPRPTRGVDFIAIYTLVN